MERTWGVLALDFFNASMQLRTTHATHLTNKQMHQLSYDEAYPCPQMSLCYVFLMPEDIKRIKVYLPSLPHFHPLSPGLTKSSLRSTHSEMMTKNFKVTDTKSRTEQIYLRLKPEV